MAEQALKKLEEQLNCSICLDTYTDPKLLQCFHVYCRQCLVPLVVRDQQGQLGLTCPTCRQVTPIPDRGVAGLQSAFHINDLLGIQESFQRVENPAATAEETATRVNPMKNDNCGVIYCSAHDGKELELYCETCGELICTRCALKGGKHQDHDYVELDQGFQKYKEDISSLLEPMEKQVVIIEKALVQLDAHCGEISDQQAATANNIHGTFKRLREVLNVRETELIGQLDRVTQGKLKGLAAQRDQIETTLAQLCSCLHFMRESLKTGNEGDVLMMKTNTVKQVKELTTPFQCHILKPTVEADTIFSASADTITACQNYGQLIAPPTKFHLTGNDASLVGEKSTIILQAIESLAMECELVSEITGTRASCSVERRGQSQYEISYQPTIKGRHQLHIKAVGQHIRGSPFSIAVKSTVEKLGTPILTMGGMEIPWGVAITQRGEVVVTEWGGHCVSVFSPSGEKIRSFGSCGSGRGKLQHPRGVALDSEGNILVVDSGNNRIQKFTAEGQLIMLEDFLETEPIQFSQPTGITVNVTNNKVYVLDRDNHRVQVLNSDLTFFSTFGSKGNGEGQFNSPTGIACDSTGKVYVADTRNYRIQIFTAEGMFLYMFGRRGQGRGELGRPFGVAIDTSGMVYVSEWGNRRISVFTSEGQLVTSFGRRGEGPGELECPRGVAVDSCAVLYVCDKTNNSVQVF